MIDKINNLDKFKGAEIDDDIYVNCIVYADDIMLITTNDKNIRISQTDFQELIDTF